LGGGEAGAEGAFVDFFQLHAGFAFVVDEPGDGYEEEEAY